MIVGLVRELKRHSVGLLVTDFGEESSERVIESVENRSEGSRADALGRLIFCRYCLETGLQLLDVLGGYIPTGIRSIR